MLAVARELDPAHSVGRIWLLSPCVDFLYGANPQKFDTLLVKSRFPRPGLLMNSRTYLCF